MKKIEKEAIKEKKIPLKNYFEVGIMIIAIIALTLLLRQWFNSYKDTKLKESIISGEVQEVTYFDFDNFVTAHDDFLLYIGVSSDSNCRELESDLIDVLEKRNIKNEVVFLNISNEKDKKKILDEIVDKYFNSKVTINYPFFGVVNDKEVKDFAQKEKNNFLKISEIEKLLDMYEVGV